MESATSTGGPAHPTTNGTGIAVENPATGETLAHVPDLGPDDLAALVARARAAQPEWFAAGFDGRARILMAARAWMVGSVTWLSR